MKKNRCCLIFRLIILVLMVLFIAPVFAHADDKINITDITCTYYSITYGNDEYIVVGESGVILASQNGVNWEVRESGVKEPLYNIIWNGDLYVAVGGSYSKGCVILTSKDGVNWEKQSCEFYGELHGIVWNGSKFVAVGGRFQQFNPKEGIVLTSDDGVIWERSILPTEADMCGVAWGEGTFVAVGSNGQVFTSMDGVNWAARFSGSIYTINDITYANNRFTAVGGSTKGIVFSSEDGITWSVQADVVTAQLNSVMWSGSNYYAFGNNGCVISSSDGSNWSVLNSLKGNVSEAIYKNGILAVGSYGLIATSSDMSSWEYNRLSTSTNLNGFVYDGNRFLAVGKGDHGGRVLKSGNADYWEEISILNTYELKSIVWGNGKFVAVGSYGDIYTSTDGTTWKYITRYTYELNKVIWNGKNFIAAGDFGLVLKSSDGLTWEKKIYGESVQHYEGIATNGTVEVLVAQDVIHTIQDGVTKGYYRTLYEEFVYDVVWDGKRFVATGERHVYISNDGVSWTYKDLRIDYSLTDIQEDMNTKALVKRIDWDGSDYIGVGVIYDEWLMRSICNGVFVSNDGRSWIIKSIIDDVFNDIEIVDNTAILIGDNGHIVKCNTEPSEITSIKMESEPKIVIPNKDYAFLGYEVYAYDQFGLTMSATPEFTLASPVTGVSIAYVADNRVSLKVDSSTQPGYLKLKVTIGTFTEIINMSIERAPSRVESISIDGPKSVTVPSNGTVEFEYTYAVKDQYGLPMTGEKITWTIDTAPQGVSIDADTGVLRLDNTAQSGSIAVRATTKSIIISATYKVTILRPLQVVSSIEITGTDRFVINGVLSTISQYAAIVKNQYGSVIQGKTVNWSLVSPVSGVSISSTGRLTINNVSQKGGCTIKATCDNVSGIYEVIWYKPVNLVRFAADPSGPQTAGKNITISISATGGTELNYRFEVYEGETCVEQSRYSTENTYVWVPQEAGKYTLYAYLKEKSSTEDYDAYKEISYTVTEAIEISYLKAYPTSPQPINMEITLRAKAVGGSDLRYRFEVYDGESYTELKDYSTDNTCLWVPEKAGTHTIYLYVKHKNSAADYDEYEEIDYMVTEKLKGVVINSLSTDSDGPLPVGADIELTAKASGGDNLQYMFRVFDGKRYTNLSSYSSDNTCIWIPEKPGTYRIFVYVKEEDSEADYDAEKKIVIEIE